MVDDPTDCSRSESHDVGDPLDLGPHCQAAIVTDGALAVRYIISSVPLGVEQFATWVRGHWEVEHSLHWCLEVTFCEEQNPVCNRSTAEDRSIRVFC